MSLRKVSSGVSGRWSRAQFLGGLFVASAGVALALDPNSTPLSDPRVRAVGNKLTCQCGCGHTVSTCDMLHCSFCEPARTRLKELVDGGQSQQQILDSFVKDYGLKVLQQPPTEGFNMLGWTMPFVGLGAFTAICLTLISKMRKPELAVAVTPKPSTAVNAQAVADYEKRIEKELELL